MSKVLGGKTQNQFIEPAAVAVQAPAVAVDGAPQTEVRSGSAEAEGTAGDLLRKYRPSTRARGIGSVGTGLSV